MAKALGTEDLTTTSAGQERAEVSLLLPSLGDLAQRVFWDTCFFKELYFTSNEMGRFAFFLLAVRWVPGAPPGHGEVGSRQGS